MVERLVDQTNQKGPFAVIPGLRKKSLKGIPTEENHLRIMAASADWRNQWMAKNIAIPIGTLAFYILKR